MYFQVWCIADFFHHLKKTVSVFCWNRRTWKHFPSYRELQYCLYCLGIAFKLLHLFFKLKVPNCMWLIADAGEKKNISAVSQFLRRQTSALENQLQIWGLCNEETIPSSPQGSKKLICFFLSRCCCYFSKESPFFFSSCSFLAFGNAFLGLLLYIEVESSVLYVQTCMIHVSPETVLLIFILRLGNIIPDRISKLSKVWRTH